MVVRYAWSRRLSYDFFSLLCATHVRNGECVLRLFYVTLEGYSNVKSILLLLLTFFFFFCRHQILCFVFNHAAFASGSLYRYCSRLSAMLPAIVCDLVLSHSVFFRSSFLFWSSHSFANIFRRPSIGFFLPSMRCFAHFNLDRSLWNLHVHSILDLVQEKRFRETQKRKCEISRMKNEWASERARTLSHLLRSDENEMKEKELAQNVHATISQRPGWMICDATMYSYTVHNVMNSLECTSLFSHPPSLRISFMVYFYTFYIENDERDYIFLCVMRRCCVVVVGCLRCLFRRLHINYFSTYL